jgi:hypothetical protein
MKIPRQPREVTIDERAHTESIKSGIFKNKITTDYVSTGGMVREVLKGRKKPKYFLVDTGEPVKVKFYGEISKDELMYYADPEIYE